jgi:hypothetical protein
VISDLFLQRIFVITAALGRAITGHVQKVRNFFEPALPDSRDEHIGFVLAAPVGVGLLCTRWRC